jgi:high-affinity iron transporter
MISSFLVALREGLEAALIVGIVLVSLGRSGRSHLARFVWFGVGLAVSLSFAAALALEMWKINEDGFEGVLLLSSAVFVVTVIVWMSRSARHLRKDIETKVQTYAGRSDVGAGLGIGAFVFLMVLREGAELALILRAVEVSAAGAAVWVGTLLGLSVAVAVGWFFFHGTLRIPLGQFFKVTSWILVIVAFQLFLTGIHELSESGWVPASPTEMSLVGPVVRNEVFFFAAILGVAAVMVLREWLAIPKAAEDTVIDDTERKRLARERQRQGRWLVAAGATFVLVLLILTADFVYARTNDAPPNEKELYVMSGVVRVPTDMIGDGALHFYRATVNGKPESFMVVRRANGEWFAGIAGCLICGRHGYRQEGNNAVCRNCGAEIPLSELGKTGGCNPIPLPTSMDNSDLLIQASDLSQSIPVFQQ